MEAIRIRTASVPDAPILLEIIRALAVHENSLERLRTTREELAEAKGGETLPYHALIAADDQGPVGFVSYTIGYSAWLGTKYMLPVGMEDRLPERSVGP